MCLITPARIKAPATNAKITAQVSREIIGRLAAASRVASVLFSFKGILFSLLKLF